MVKFDRSTLLSVENVIDAMNPAERRSDTIVRDAINKLISLELAKRPKGARKGACLTAKGRSMWEKING